MGDLLVDAQHQFLILLEGDLRGVFSFDYAVNELGGLFPACLKGKPVYDQGAVEVLDVIEDDRDLAEPGRLDHRVEGGIDDIVRGQNEGRDPFLDQRSGDLVYLGRIGDVAADEGDIGVVLEGFLKIADIEFRIGL